jgi:hypothetical protein
MADSCRQVHEMTTEQPDAGVYVHPMHAPMKPDVERPRVR